MHTAPITKKQKLDGIMAQLKAGITTWEPTLRDIGDYISPYNHEWSAQLDAGNGARRDSYIINETPVQAVDIAVSGLFNGLCDPTERWMSLETDDPDLNKIHAVREWCEEVTTRHLAEVAKSNFYTVVPEDFRSILAYGTCASITMESFEDSCLWFAAFPIGSYWIGNGSRRNVVTIAREISMTAGQIVQEFKVENVSDAVRNAFESNRKEQSFCVTHVVHPNEKFIQGQAFKSSDKRYLSTYYEAGQASHEDKMLLEEGFDTFPVQVARWSTRGNAPWGFGPGHNILGSARALQAYEIDLALARELQLNPTLIVPAGVNMSAISLLPGALVPATDPAGAQGLRPLREVRFDLTAGQKGIQELEERIREGFYNNIFMMMSNDQNGQMTAREVMERAREKRLALTPILRLTHEYLTPRIARNLDIMGKRGKLPPFPPEMRGSTLRIQYRSVLAKAAEMEKSAVTKDQIIQFAVPMSQIDPTILDNYDMDELARETSRNDGMPTTVMRDPVKVEEMRAARAAQQQQQQQLVEMAHAAETAETLSKADTSGKNALTDVIAQAGK